MPCSRTWYRGRSSSPDLPRRARGRRALELDRAGFFGVVEVWLDNTLLLEVLSRPEVERYQRFMNLDGAAQFFGPGLEPAPVA